jgi:hypothetical protein
MQRNDSAFGRFFHGAWFHDVYTPVSHGEPKI